MSPLPVVNVFAIQHNGSFVCYKELHTNLLKWFTDHASEITELSFARGAAQDREEWSDFLWYINRMKEGNNVDEIFSISALCKAVTREAVKGTKYGVKNGGTTIQLPFGFVQWHQGQMQFHHKYIKVKKLLK